METSRKPGTVYWIDHYTIPTNDVRRAMEFHERVIGAISMPNSGLPPFRGMFQAFSHADASKPLTLKAAGSHHGLFIMKDPLPPAEAPGRRFPAARAVHPAARCRRARAAPRCRRRRALRSRAHVSRRRRRTAIYWLDADGNQLELWAPETMPDGAMEGAGPLNIGRISHGVYASRDLARTIDFFGRYCALEPLQSAAIPAGTVVFPLAAGGRLVFKLSAKPGLRASGSGAYPDLHAALVVHEADFWSNHERMWAELPEGDGDGGGANLPARTILHASPNGQRFKAAFGRGDDWIDHDENLFHFIGGGPRGGSMASYDRFFLDDYMDEYLANHLGA